MLDKACLIASLFALEEEEGHYIYHSMTVCKNIKNQLNPRA